MEALRLELADATAGRDSAQSKLDAAQRDANARGCDVAALDATNAQLERELEALQVEVEAHRQAAAAAQTQAEKAAASAAAAEARAQDALEQRTAAEAAASEAQDAVERLQEANAALTSQCVAGNVFCTQAPPPPNLSTMGPDTSCCSCLRGMRGQGSQAR